MKSEYTATRDNPVNYTLEDLEQLRLELGKATGLEWEVFRLRRWWQNEDEIVSYEMKAKIGDISIYMMAIRNSDREGTPIDDWGRWWTHLQRPRYCTLQTGGPGDTPLEAWENLQPRLNQWINRREEVERQLS